MFKKTLHSKQKIQPCAKTGFRNAEMLLAGKTLRQPVRVDEHMLRFGFAASTGEKHVIILLAVRLAVLPLQTGVMSGHKHRYRALSRFRIG